MNRIDPRHERIEELVAADALGGLDDADRTALFRELATHGAGCEECGRILSDYREVAGHLALALEPLPLEPATEQRVLASIGAPPTGPASVRAFRRRWAVALAAAAVLIVGAGFAGFAAAPRTDGLVSAQVMDFLWEPGTRFVSFPGRQGQQLAVAFHPDSGEALVIGRNLQPPPKGMVYELWYRPVGGSEMRPAGTFAPTDGAVEASARVGASISALAVSLEPAGGSDHPTRAALFAARV